MIKKVINIPIYECKIVLCLDEDINEYYQRLRQKFGLEDDGEDTACEGLVVCTNLRVYYLLLGIKYLNINLLVHETTHIALRILRERGHNSLKEGDEPLSYLAGYIAAEIEKILIKNNIELKKPKIRKRAKKE